MIIRLKFGYWSPRRHYCQSVEKTRPHNTHANELSCFQIYRKERGFERSTHSAGLSSRYVLFTISLTRKLNDEC